MEYFLLDTSALVKYYHPETGSQWVLNLFRRRGVVCTLDRLSDFKEQHIQVFFQRYGVHLEARVRFRLRVCKTRPLNMAPIVEELLGDSGEERIAS